MKKFAIRFAAACIALVMLSGCAEKSKTKEDGSDPSSNQIGGNTMSVDNISSKGRYIEEEIDLPEGVATIFDLEDLADGTIAMFTNQGYYISTDDGDTWEKKEIPGLTWELIALASIGKDGSVFVGGFEGSQEDLESMTESPDTKYIYIDANGNVSNPVLDLPTYGEMYMGGAGFASGSFAAVDEKVPEKKGMKLLTDETDESGLQEISPDDVFAAGDNEDVMMSDGAVLIDGEVQIKEEMPVDDEYYASADMFDMGDMTNMMQTPFSIKILENGNLLAELSNILYVFDTKTGDVLQKFELTMEEGWIETYEVLDDKLVIVTSQVMLTYDLKTGDEVDNNPIMEEILTAKTESSGMQMVFGGGMSSKVLQYSSSDKSSYIADSSGISRLAESGSVMEQLVIGEDTYFSDMTKTISAFTATQDHSFLTAYYEVLGFSMSVQMMRYRYSEETPLETQMDLTVYGLYDNSSVRQAVSTYRKAHPEVKVTFQIGIKENSGVAETDALKSLTTEIMAGNGPDILMLDGMSIASLADKGILSDIADVLSDADQTYYENIVSAYESDNGIYAIPTRFAIPYLMGSKDGIDAYSELSDIPDYLESVDSEGFGGHPAAYLTALLYRTMAPALLSDNADMNEESLADFYAQIQRLHDITLKNLNEEDAAGVDDGYTYETGHYHAVTRFSLMQSMFYSVMYTDTLSLSLMANVREDLGAAHAVMKTYPEKLATQPLTIDGKTVFVPLSVTGISAKSEHQEEAKDFLKTLLSAEVQSSSAAEGFPVNKIAMDNMMTQPVKGDENIVGIAFFDEETGESKEVEVTFPTKEQTDAFKSVVEKVNLPAITEQIILSIILEQIPSLIDGRFPEDAASDAMQKIKLYQSEGE